MLLGAMSAVAYGAILPGAMLILAKGTDSFIFHEARGLLQRQVSTVWITEL